MTENLAKVIHDLMRLVQPSAATKLTPTQAAVFERARKALAEAHSQ